MVDGCVCVVWVCLFCFAILVLYNLGGVFWQPLPLGYLFSSFACGGMFDWMWFLGVLICVLMPT